VEPFPALGDVLNGKSIYRLDELNGAGLGCFDCKQFRSAARELLGLAVYHL